MAQKKKTEQGQTKVTLSFETARQVLVALHRCARPVVPYDSDHLAMAEEALLVTKANASYALTQMWHEVPAEARSGIPMPSE